jgi:hypothetical protein
MVRPYISCFCNADGSAPDKTAFGTGALGYLRVRLYRDGLKLRRVQVEYLWRY